MVQRTPDSHTLYMWSFANVLRDDTDEEKVLERYQMCTCSDTWNSTDEREKMLHTVAVQSRRFEELCLCLSY